jgi:glycosyltransferase involved in cell wall biosynthesis
MVGDGVERATLERSAATLGVDHAVQFEGAVPHERLPAYYASADVLVGPSVVDEDGTSEAFGMVFAEAMASGCPVVATRVGGIPDVVEDGESGLLVPQRDSAALAEATLAVLQDGTLRARMGAAGVARARDRFDQRRTHAEYAQILTEIAA